MQALELELAPVTAVTAGSAAAAAGDDNDDVLLLALPLDDVIAQAAAAAAAREAVESADPVVAYDDVIEIDTREGRASDGISNERLASRLYAEHAIKSRVCTLSNYDFWYVQEERRASGAKGRARVHTLFERKSMCDAESSLIGSNHWQDQIARLQSARRSPSDPLPRFVLLLVGAWSSLRRPSEAAVAISGMCDRLQGYYANAHVIPVAHDELLPQVLATSIRHAKEHAAGYRFNEMPELAELKRTMLRTRVETCDTWSLFAYGAIHGVSVPLAKRIQARYPTLHEAIDAAQTRGSQAFLAIQGVGSVLALRLVTCLAPERAARETAAKAAKPKKAAATPKTPRKRRTANSSGASASSDIGIVGPVKKPRKKRTRNSVVLNA